jgi:oligopeptide/dipeptide ABC transporter ATP-binding protein
MGGRDVLSLHESEMEKVRGNEMSMIFQEPMTSLNPVITVGKQLMEVFMTHQGMDKGKAKASAVEALRTVKIALPEQRVNEYPHQLSGGMRQRVMIAMAMSCRPKLLIADEPTTALDVTIQAQILRLMRELRETTGTSVMLITHDLGVVSEVCSRAIIIYSGQIIEEGKVGQIFDNPLHPYTVGLLHSLPEFAKDGRLHVIDGSVPPPGRKPPGCVFHPRCPKAMPECSVRIPGYTDAGEGHRVKCLLHERGQ